MELSDTCLYCKTDSNSPIYTSDGDSICEECCDGLMEDDDE